MLQPVGKMLGSMPGLASIGGEGLESDLIVYAEERKATYFQQVQVDMV